MCQLSLSLRKQPQAASGAAHLGVTGVLTAFTPIVAGRPTSAGRHSLRPRAVRRTERCCAARRSVECPVLCASMPTDTTESRARELRAGVCSRSSSRSLRSKAKAKAAGVSQRHTTSEVQPKPTAHA